MRYSIVYLLAIVVIGLAGCDTGPSSTRGFSLPEGNAENGKLVFMKYQCLACHQMADVEPSADIIDNPNLSVRLGGKSTRVKTYADLLTSVINPSHRLAKGYRSSDIQVDGVSKMKVYNDVMTVTELVDLVTFLQGNYEVIPYTRPNYQYYKYK